MPKKTFYNLDISKRQQLENLAIKEFAEFGYDKFGISNYVVKANIAKGSFYQYFESKQDLFIYLINEVIMKKKMQFLKPVVDKYYDKDIFKMIQEGFVVGIKFALENPEMDKIGNWLILNKNHEIFKKIIGNESNVAFYKDLIIKSQNQGIIRKEINVNLIAYLFMEALISSSNYALNGIIEKQINHLDVTSYLYSVIDETLDLFIHGIGIEGKNGNNYKSK